MLAYIANFCPLSYFTNLHNETLKVQHSASCVEIMSFFCLCLWASYFLVDFQVVVSETHIEGLTSR